MRITIRTLREWEACSEAQARFDTLQAAVDVITYEPEKFSMWLSESYQKADRRWAEVRGPVLEAKAKEAEEKAR